MKLDTRDVRILQLQQMDAEMPLHMISQRVNLSLSACSRRLSLLKHTGYIRKTIAILDRKSINVPTTAFIMIKAVHNTEWTEQLRRSIENIPEIVEAHRLAGSIDYVLKVVLPDAQHYDIVYKKLIDLLEIRESSAYFSMEIVKDESPIPLDYIKTVTV